MQDALAQFIVRQERKNLNRGVIVPALGAETAVHGAVAASCIDDGAQNNAAPKGRLAQRSGPGKQLFLRQGQKREGFGGRCSRL